MDIFDDPELQSPEKHELPKELDFDNMTEDEIMKIALEQSLQSARQEEHKRGAKEEETKNEENV